MPVIELPNGKAAEFPDDMPLDKIKAVIRAKFPPNGNENKPQKQLRLLQRAADYAERGINQPIQRNIVNPIASAVGGFGQGLLNIGPGLYNLGASGANALGANLPKSPMLNFAGESLPAKAGELASFFAGPSSVIKVLGRVPELSHAAHSAMKIPMLAEGIKHASNILGRASPKTKFAGKVAGNALLGGAYAPDNQLLGMGLGAGGPLIGQGISKGASAAYNALKPSKLFRGNLTPQELKRNLYAAKGTETGLGDIIGSPMLKRLNENILSKIPFSGANEAMQRTAGKIIEQGEGHLKNILGGNKSENIEQDLTQSLQKFYKSHQTQKNALYNEVNKIANESKLKLPLSGFSETAKKYSDALENTNILKYEPEVASLINKIRGYKSPVTSKTTTGKLVDKYGNPLINETTNKYPSLEEANILKGKLNNLAENYMSSPNPSDRHAASILGNLVSSLKKDIAGAINSSENKALMNAYHSAEKNYAENFSPFLEKEVYKFINGGSDPDTIISSFIKTGKANDRSNLIGKVLTTLPKEKKNLLGYGYLQRAVDENGVLNPLKLKTLLSKNALGDRQFMALFPDKKTQRALRDYVSLVDKNTKGLKLMQNPETGQMNMDILPLISQSSSGLAGKLIGAPFARKALTSEKTRTNLVNKMIKDSKKGM